jgi:hypothetical protein
MYVILKKMLFILVLISTLLIAFCQQALEVQLVSVSNIYFNDDGNTWAHNVIINQKPFFTNKEVYFKLSETNILFIKNCCNDEQKQSDCGNNSVLIKLNKIILSKEYSFTYEAT